MIAADTTAPPRSEQMTLVAPSLRRRMACWLYEGILLFAVAFLATWLFSTLGQMRSGIDPRRPLLIVFLFVIFGIYFVWFWAHGQTLAMKTWDIRVVDSRGQRITQLRALGRYALSWAWFLPPLVAVAPFHLPVGEISVIFFGWVAFWALLSRFHPQRQFLHDILAGTRLVTSAPLSR
jgi:uncharacterized RDD family membrane protein YckC